MGFRFLGLEVLGVGSLVRALKLEVFYCTAFKGLGCRIQGVCAPRYKQMHTYIYVHVAQGPQKLQEKSKNGNCKCSYQHARPETPNPKS